MGWRHPDIRMRSISDLRPHRKALQFQRENIKHGLPRNKSCATQRNFEFITSAIIVSANLFRSPWYFDGIQSGDSGRIKLVQSSIDVPAVESSDTVSLVF